MNDSKLTKVTQKDLDEAHENDDYIYSNDRKRLICCPPIPSHDDLNDLDYTYHFSGVKIICDNACDIKHCSWFYEKDYLNLKLPNGITHIGDYAFKGRNIDMIVIPSSVIYMGADPFALTRPWKITINDNNRFIFRNNNLIDIKEQRLIHNNSIYGDITIDNDIIVIGEYSFSRNNEEPNEEKNLSITIPSTIQKIGNNAFENSNVSFVFFLGLPESIGTDLFKGCTQLKQIYVPHNMVKDFKKALPDVSEKIDESGMAVNGIVFRNMLSSIGITNYHRISLDYRISIYGFIQDEKFHFSDENGKEISRDTIGFNKGVLVLEIQDNLYTMLPENKCRKHKAFAIDAFNNISWFENNELLYFSISEYQILIPKTEYVEVNYETQPHYETARFFGQQSDTLITAYAKDVYSYIEDSKIRMICRGKLYSEKYDDVKVYTEYQYETEKWAVLVCKNGKWGMITQDGNDLNPQYRSIQVIRFPLFKLETFDNKFGLTDKYGDLLFRPIYNVFEYEEDSYSHASWFIITDTEISKVEFEWCKDRTKRRLICEIPEIDKSKIKKWGTCTFVRDTRRGEEHATFLKIIKEDGEEFIIDNKGNTLSRYDELEDWRLYGDYGDGVEIWDWH